MAFKMNRPSKMNGPKKSGLKLGRNKTIIGNELNADTTAFFYNSKMGPMKMVSPSALKQMEEATTKAATEAYPGGEVEEKAVNTAKEQIPTGTIPGQDILSDGGNFYVEEGQDQIYIEDPDGILKAWSEEGDGYLTSDEDFIYELTEENYYRITGVADVSEGGEFEEGVPGHHANPK